MAIRLQPCAACHILGSAGGGTSPDIRRTEVDSLIEMICRDLLLVAMGFLCYAALQVVQNATPLEHTYTYATADFGFFPSQPKV